MHFGRCASGELRERRLGTRQLLSQPSAAVVTLFCRRRAKALNLVFIFVRWPEFNYEPNSAKRTRATPTPQAQHGFFKTNPFIVKII